MPLKVVMCLVFFFLSLKTMEGADGVPNEIGGLGGCAFPRSPTPPLATRAPVCDKRSHVA